MSDPQQTNPALVYLFTGVMFVAMAILSIVNGVPVLAWSFFPIGALWIVIWFAKRSNASRDES